MLKRLLQSEPFAVLITILIASITATVVGILLTLLMPDTVTFIKVWRD